MPVSRLISDLDHLITELSVDGPTTSPILDELRLTVARINEFSRQLDIAQLKLASALSLAGMKVIERQIESGDTLQLLNNRFKIPEDLSTGIAGIDDAHRAIFQSGNRLYWLALQRDVNAKEVEDELTHLIQCANTDFSSEEQMMHNSGYAHFDHHRAVHQSMWNYLSEMQELVSTQPLAVVVKLEKFLGSWFLWHLQRDDIEFSKYYLHERSDLPAPIAKPPASVVHEEPAILGHEAIARNPVRELGYLFRGQISSWLISWRERRHVARTSRAALSQYRSITASHPELAPIEVYRFVVMEYTGCDSNTAKNILNRAEESYAEWPVSRALKLRDVVHYLTVTEYLDLYGKDFWMRSKINKLVAAHIPKNL